MNSQYFTNSTILVTSPSYVVRDRSLTGPITNLTVSRFTISPDGGLMAASANAIDPSSTGIICIRDAATGRELRILALRSHYGGYIAFSLDGSRIVCGGDARDISVWDTKTGKRLATLEPLHNNNIESVAWSPDGKTIATASWDSTIRLWDAGTFRPVAVLRAHNGSVKTCFFSQNSQYLVTGGEDRLIKYWDIKKARDDPQMVREVLTLRGHTATVTSVVLSRDNRLLVSCSADNTVRFWRATTIDTVGELIHADEPIR